MSQAGKIDHVFHVWINSESRRQHGEGGIDPHGQGLYDFKAAMQILPYLGKRIGEDRRKALPLVHQQSSRTAPVKLEENFLMCGFGVRLTTCPILQRLRATFDEERQRRFPKSGECYYGSITDEEVDDVAAKVCVWHMLMGNGETLIDWREGAIQDSSDRLYWKTVYEHLSMPEEEPQE